MLPVLVWAGWVSGRTAVARVLVRYGMSVADATAVEAAIGLTPRDAEAHDWRGAILNYRGRPEEAVSELEQAVSLRPRDYGLWMDLGMTLDDLGDQSGALAAFNESVRLAPFYARPRWQRGNLLFRLGQYEEAFAEMRRAAASNPALLPNLIDLAWSAGGQDPAVTEQLVQLRSPAVHLALARFLVRHNRPDEAIAHLKAAAPTDGDVTNDLIHQLIAAGAYSQAFQVWPRMSNQTGTTTIVFDGGFEGSLPVDESGLGWRPSDDRRGLSFALDQSKPQSGARSLRIDFNGEPTRGPMLSQLVLVQPAARYRLSFAARVSDLVTGGPPFIAINEAGPHGKQLARTAAVPNGSANWTPYTAEFVTGATTKAISIVLVRESCATATCPIFGSLNLDSFSIEPLK